jgi:hypothetical protein
MISENFHFMRNTEENFISCVRGGNKKLVLFGAGYEMSQAMKKIILPNCLEVSYAVDNDFRKWYARYFGIRICEPNRLATENAEQTVVLITSRYPFRIEEQLEGMGISHYYSSFLFLEEYIGEHQFMVTF